VIKNEQRNDKQYIFSADKEFNIKNIYRKNEVKNMDDIYSEKNVIAFGEDDEISTAEEGFMMGYLNA